MDETSSLSLSPQSNPDVSLLSQADNDRVQTSKVLRPSERVGKKQNSELVLEDAREAATTVSTSKAYKCFSSPVVDPEDAVLVHEL